MVRQIIAVDIDDVLVMHFQDLIDWYNAEYGTRLTLANNHPTAATVDTWGTDEDAVAIRRVQRFFSTPAFHQAKPYQEAAIVLERLSAKYDLVVVTSRDTLIEEFTRAWLEEHFAEIFKEAHFTALYSLESKKRSKIDVCRTIHASYLIDDVLETAKDAARHDIQAVLFGDYPWNQARSLPKNVTRCKDWAVIQEYFDAQN